MASTLERVDEEMLNKTNIGQTTLENVLIKLLDDIGSLVLQ